MSHIVFNNPKFQRWKQSIEVNGNIIKSIEVLANVSRKQSNFFGALLDCQLVTPEGVEIPRCVMLHGDSAVVIPVLKCCEDEEIYTLLVEQRRIVDGDYAKEFPSGGEDFSVDDLKSIACREIKEELHLSVSPEELIPLNTTPVKMNPSLYGDLAYFFYFEREVPFSFLKEMEGLNTGCHEEYEYVRVKVQKMSEVANCMTSSALIGLKLLERALNRVF